MGGNATAQAQNQGDGTELNRRCQTEPNTGPQAERNRRGLFGLTVVALCSGRKQK
jgi:hypothetical protein